MIQWKEQPTPVCPRCGLTENARHVWLCQEPVVFFVWDLLMSSFSAWLELVHTATAIAYWIIRRLKEWQSSEPLFPLHTDMPGLGQAFAA
jgi:hypothetical protein